LSLSPLVRLSRAACFAIALMLLIFAVWALFGFGYPFSPLPFTFNAVSKVVAFVVGLSLFLPHPDQASTPEPAAFGKDAYATALTALIPLAPN
jgi:glucose dehydrogenase